MFTQKQSLNLPLIFLGMWSLSPAKSAMASSTTVLLEALFIPLCLNAILRESRSCAQRG
jgi:hypothetical protein